MNTWAIEKKKYQKSRNDKEVIIENFLELKKNLSMTNKRINSATVLKETESAMIIKEKT